MDSANIHPQYRDHCAIHRIEFKRCMQRNSPFYLRCTEAEEKLFECVQDELLHDMKEFEREKRLNARERRIAQKAASEG